MTSKTQAVKLVEGVTALVGELAAKKAAIPANDAKVKRTTKRSKDGLTVTTTVEILKKQTDENKASIKTGKAEIKTGVRVLTGSPVTGKLDEVSAALVADVTYFLNLPSLR